MIKSGSYTYFRNSSSETPACDRIFCIVPNLMVSCAGTTTRRPLRGCLSIM
jgi:hypothetical protein